MSRSIDIARTLLPAAVIAVVGLLIFPVSTELLDGLLAISLIFSLALVLAALSMESAEKFTTLPTLILLATLLRLGLNLATSRQILSTGQAPELVKAFGEYVVQGNIVIGLVIFIILTVIQFFVIAKGAERVAEVAARFSLDALPGRQMALDSDLRAGLISVHEVREKRIELQRESKLYGALDGAMKFIKGDAIAGLIMSLVNIIAGFLVGILQQNLSFLEALEHFTVLSIGDGVAAQVPSLLVALAAGLVVTRVSNNDGSSIGGESFRQLFRNREIIFLLGGASFILSFIDGFPREVFLTLSILLILFSFKRNKISPAQQEISTFPQKRVAASLTLFVSPSTLPLFQITDNAPGKLEGIRSELFEEYGILLPELHFEVAPNLPELEMQIMHFGRLLASLKFSSEIKVTGDLLLSSIKKSFEKEILSFLTDTHTRSLLLLYETSVEDLVNSVSHRAVTITQLTILCRRLLRDNLSIREFPRILQKIIETQALPESVYEGEEIISHLRASLKSTIKQELEAASAVYLLAPKFEQEISDGWNNKNALDPILRQKIIDGIVRIKTEENKKVILITSIATRRALQNSVDSHAENVLIVSFDEVFQVNLREKIQLLNIDDFEQIEVPISQQA